MYAETKIIGVGDFGAKIVNYLKSKQLFNTDFAVVAENKIDDTIITDVDVLFIFIDLSDENIFSMYGAVRCVNGLTELGLIGLDFYDIRVI